MNPIRMLYSLSRSSTARGLRSGARSQLSQGQIVALSIMLLCYVFAAILKLSAIVNFTFLKNVCPGSIKRVEHFINIR